MSYIFSPDASISYQKKISKSIPKRMRVCTLIAKEAQKHNVNPILAVALAYHESRFSSPISKAGAKGPLGVITKYHCQNEPCNLIKAGIHALKKYTKRTNNTCDAIAQYNSNLDAHCQQNNPATKYAHSVLNLYYELKLFNQKKCYSKPIK